MPCFSMMCTGGGLAGVTWLTCWEYSHDFKLFSDCECLAGFLQFFDSYGLRWASKRLRRKPNMVKWAVTLNGQALEYAAEELRNRPANPGPLWKRNYEIVKLAVEDSGDALQFAPDWQGDRELVRIAVKSSPRAIRFASAKLQKDESIVYEAAMVDLSALKLLEKSKRTEVARSLEGKPAREIQKFLPAGALAKDDAKFLEGKKAEEIAPRIETTSEGLEGLRKHRDKHGGHMLEVAKKHEDGLEYASDEQRGNKEFVLQVVRCHGCALRHAKPVIRGDRDVAVAAVAQDVEAIVHVGLNLLRDSRSQDRNSLDLDRTEEGFPKSILRAHPAALRCLALVEADENDMQKKLLRDMAELANDEKFMMSLVKEDGRNIRFASEEVKQDKDVVKAAAKESAAALLLVSGEHRVDLEVLRSVFVYRKNWTWDKLIEVPHVLGDGFAAFRNRCIPADQAYGVCTDGCSNVKKCLGIWRELICEEWRESNCCCTIDIAKFLCEVVGGCLEWWGCKPSS